MTGEPGTPDGAMHWQPTNQAVLKWVVPVDGEWHNIGGGKVAMVGEQGDPDQVCVWTVETVGRGDEVRKPRRVTAVGTGQPIPDQSEHIGSVSMPVRSPHCLVWHVFEEVLF